MDETDQLVRRVLGGEVEVFAEIVRRYEQPVWRVVAAMLGSIEDAREMMQQVFVHAYLHLDQYRPGHNFEVWLKGIARNCARKELRRLVRESRRLAVYRERLSQTMSTATDRDEEAWREALDHCREQLPERSAMALDQRYIQGKTFSEIAEMLSTTTTAIEKLLSRARVALRDCIHARMATQ